MKKAIIFCLVCISLTNGYAQDFFRYIAGERHYFEIASDMVIVKFDREMTEDAIERSFRESASLQVSDIISLMNNKYKLVRFDGSNRNDMVQMAKQRRNNDGILFVGNVLIDEFGEKTKTKSM